MQGYLKDEDSLMKHCKFELKLCDEERREKAHFSAQEPILVKLTVYNISEHPIAVLIGSGQYFSSGGLHVRIDNEEPARIGNNKLSNLRLNPDDNRRNYTFVKTFTKPKSEPDMHLTYSTPALGTLTARVWVYNAPIEVWFLFSVS